MRFRKWLENEEKIDPEIQKIIADFRKQSQMRQINQQGGIGKALHKEHGVWLLPFSAVKKDSKEGWYVDWSETPGSISDIEDVQIGDKVADYAINMTPYWEISGTDPQKNRIYLTPIEPNPFLTGIGAGGKKLGQHDYEVHSGEYERKAIDHVLDRWKKGEAHSIQDIAYLLLGAVPVQMGPNGSQGGWYASRDTGSNRGGRKGMSAKEIMQKDAETAKRQFGFSVPIKALSGEIDPYEWDQFIDGQTTSKDSQVEGENFDDPKVMLKMILNNPQPQIKMRNWKVLTDEYRGTEGYRKESRSLGYDQTEKKWKAGDYKRKELLPYIKQAAIGLAQMDTPGERDPYWHLKEKAIVFAGQHGWNDVLELFENSKDPTNRKYLFDQYTGDRYGHTSENGEKKQPNEKKLFELLENETNAEVLQDALSFLYKKYPEKTWDWMDRHEDVLEKAYSQSYYGDQLKNLVAKIKNLRDLKLK